MHEAGDKVEGSSEILLFSMLRPTFTRGNGGYNYAAMAAWNWLVLLLSEAGLVVGDITPKLARHLEFYDRYACRQLDWGHGMWQHGA